MATVSWGSIPPAAAASAESNSFVTANEIALHVAIANAINTAIAAKLSTTTVACAAYTAPMIQNQMLLCEGLGYTVAYSVTTLTLSW